MKKSTISRLCIVLGTTLLLSACGSSKSSSSAPKDSSSSYSTESKNTGAAPSASIDSSQKSDVAIANSTTNSATQAAANTTETSNKIIKKASIDIETKDFDLSMKNIDKSIKEMGGYVENSEVNDSKEGKSSYKNANITYRIPKDKFNDFLDASSNFGKILHKKVTGEDVTTQYYDESARVKSLQIEEERLLELVKNSKDLNNMLQIENQLASTRYEIEKLTGDLKHLDNLVDYCTVTINLSEVVTFTEAKTPFAKTLSKVLNSSLNFMVSIGRAVAIFFVAILPFIPILVIVFFLVRYMYRRKKITKK